MLRGASVDAMTTTRNSVASSQAQRLREALHNSWMVPCETLCILPRLRGVFFLIVISANERSDLVGKKMNIGKSIERGCSNRASSY